MAAVPAGFTQAFLLYAGTGVTATLFEWGGVLQRLADTPKIKDPTLTGLSYQTDVRLWMLCAWHKRRRDEELLA